MKNEKIKALATFLDCKQKELKQCEYEQNIFTYGEQEYLVLTDSESDNKAREEILNTLWAFNADFIISHCRNYEQMNLDEYNSAIKSLRQAQSNQCESLNGLIYALIDDIDEFVNDAIYTDGRGHFLSFYDGEENEVNNFYIYRVN